MAAGDEWGDDGTSVVGSTREEEEQQELPSLPAPRDESVRPRSFSAADAVHCRCSPTNPRPQRIALSNTGVSLLTTAAHVSIRTSASQASPGLDAATPPCHLLRAEYRVRLQSTVSSSVCLLLPIPCAVHRARLDVRHRSGLRAQLCTLLSLFFQARGDIIAGKAGRTRLLFQTFNLLWQHLLHM